MLLPTQEALDAEPTTAASTTTSSDSEEEEDSIVGGRCRAPSLFEARRAREVLPGASALLATALASQRSSSLELQFRDSFVNIRTGKLYSTYDILIGIPPTGADLAAGTDSRTIWRVTTKISPEHITTIPADPSEWTDRRRDDQPRRRGDPDPGGSRAAPDTDAWADAQS